MPPVTTNTINFDSNVTKVEIYNDNAFKSLYVTITTSGSTFSASGNLSFYCKVYMNDGYIIDSVTTDFDDSSSTDKIIENVTTETFSLYPISSNITITITTKKSTSQISIDLTTLSGWGNVSSGDHTIQVVAKADNYRDSEKSTAVNFSKSGG